MSSTLPLPLSVVSSLVIFATAPVSAAPYLLESPGSGFTTGYTGSYNLGFEFTVGASALNVTALGFYDMGLDGLATAHPVGLWDLAGILLASVTIPSGTSSLENGFVFQDLTSPVLLTAQTEYVLSAFWPTPQDQVYANFFAGSEPIFSADATLVGSRNTVVGTPESASPNFPVNTSLFPGTYSWVGPNLKYELATTSVPDSSSLLLEIFSLIVFGYGFRRRWQRLPGKRSIV